MLNRKKILIYYGLVYMILAVGLFFGLKAYSSSRFSKKVLDQMVSGKSKYRDMTTDLCKYQILGDPKEVGNYVKVKILCKSGKDAKSTISLSAVEDITILGFIKEYARIIGFNESLLINNFNCYSDGKLLKIEEMNINFIRPTSDLECYEK